MNPSTADILDAVDKVNAKTIFVLPNNKNIILAANQAAELMTDKELLVIPTKTIPQGITAVINFVPDVYPIWNIFDFTNQNAILHKSQIIAPRGFPCCAIYPDIDPMIVGHNTHTRVSPTPANGPIKLVFKD